MTDWFKIAALGWNGVKIASAVTMIYAAAVWVPSPMDFLVGVGAGALIAHSLHEIKEVISY